jgi:DNA polymerase III delta prime subunit
MLAPDDLTPDAFARLSAMEQSQELLRRAEFEAASSRVRHAAALDRHEGMLTQLTAIMTRQQEMQATLLEVIEETRHRITQNETRITQNEAMLQRLIDIQRHRNGH